MTTPKDIARKQAEIVGQLQQFPIGRSKSGGRAGGTVEVVVTNPLPGQPSVVQAKCANDCPPGDVQLIKADDGSYVALSPNAAVKTSETTTRQVSKKSPTKPPNKPEENIKILFYVNIEISPFVEYDLGTFEALRKEVWIGGTWPAKKIYTTPEGWRLADVFIVNTGEKEDDYVVMGRLFPATKIHEWYSQLNVSDFAVPLGTSASVLFTIEKGVVAQQEFESNSCPPYFWRYCGGGFFYSAGSEIGVNTIDAFSGHIRSYWIQAYTWYNGWQSNNFPYAGFYGPTGNRSSFVNIALHQVGMSDGQAYYSNPSKSHIVKPGSSYAALLPNWAANASLAWHAPDQTYLPPQMLFGVDVSSNWYFKTKAIKSRNINTFYSALTPGGSISVPSTAGVMGFAGEMCVTPTKDFTVDYQASNGGSDVVASTTSRGFLYEPLIVNNSGDKTLAIKQFSTKSYQSQQNNFLFSLSDSGEGANFTKISGIPLLDNNTALGRANIEGVITTNASVPTSSLSEAGQVLGGFTLLMYWYSGAGTGLYGAGFSLSANQSEKNKEIVYLKDFLLGFARFVGLTIFPFEDVRKLLPNGYIFNSSSDYYFKPLSSYINDSVYISYGFLDTDKKFYGTQSLRFSEPEKTRILPQSDKAMAKVVELKLDEGVGEINVAPNVKELPIYMATPENTGFPTIALASASYWCKTKTKGKPMPTFTTTPGEVAPVPTPTPTPTPTPIPTPTPTPTPGDGY